MNEIVKLGTKIEPYGEVGAVIYVGGERCYMLINKKECVSVLPASLIERLAQNLREN